MTKSENDRPRKGYMFVYGTLLPRLAPPEIESTVRRLRRVGRGTIRGRLFDLGDYPGAILTRSGPMIQGMIFEVPNDPEVLHRLDEFEGFDPAKPKSSLFVRKRRRAQMQDGTKIFCWVYAYNGSVKDAQPVATGDYSKSRTQR